MDYLAQFTLNSIINGALYILITLGFNLIYGVTKFVNINHGAIAVVGGYTTYYLFRVLGWQVSVSIVLGVLVAGLLGLLLDRIVFRYLRENKSSNVTQFIASLGLFTITQSVLAIVFGSQLCSLMGDGPARPYNIFGGFLTSVHLATIISALLAVFFMFLLLRYTRFGKIVRALSDDEEVAKIMGINTGQVIGWVVFIGSALAGLAGVLVGFDLGIYPAMGLIILMSGIIASIIGGIGNFYGGVLGSIILVVIENLGMVVFPSEWRMAVAFAVLVPFLIWRPQGILGKK